MGQLGQQLKDILAPLRAELEFLSPAGTCILKIPYFELETLEQHLPSISKTIEEHLPDLNQHKLHRPLSDQDVRLRFTHDIVSRINTIATCIEDQGIHTKLLILLGSIGNRD